MASGPRWGRVGLLCGVVSQMQELRWVHYSPDPIRASGHLIIAKFLLSFSRGNWNWVSFGYRHCVAIHSSVYYRQEYWPRASVISKQTISMKEFSLASEIYTELQV